MMNYPIVRLRDVAPPSRYMTSWEKIKYNKIHWFTELFSEMLGVFIIVYAGAGSTAAFVVGNITSQAIGSLLTVGITYSLGVMLAIAVCAAASAGHFNPCITVSFVIFRGFPVRKAIMYILAQILGGYLGCLFVYVQWKDLFTAAEAVLVEKGLFDSLMFSPQGPAGVFGLYVLPGASLQRVFLNEFMTDFVIGLAINACLDPTNHLVPPAVAPWAIGCAYGIGILGFSPASLAANTARDIGGRMAAMTIWGSQAVGGPYGAISALTSIPATVLAFFVYETLLGSSSRTLSPQHVAFLTAHKMYHEEKGLVPPGHLQALNQHRDMTSSRSFEERHIGTKMMDVADSSV